jgi:hypothetical protein
MRRRALSGVCFPQIPLYGFSPLPLVVNISLPTVEAYSCLITTADVCITFLPQGLELPTMAKNRSTSTRTIRTHLGLFRAASSCRTANYRNKNSSADDPISQVRNSEKAPRSFFSDETVTSGSCHPYVLLVPVSQSTSPTCRQLSKSMMTHVPSSSI